jgi:arabinose-5-phosphate isomerase
VFGGKTRLLYFFTMIATVPHADHATVSRGAIALAREVLEIEAAAITALIERLDERFLTAVRLLLNCRGRVVVTGVGKSGQIGRKVASTMASTGTPAFFVHPGEASHGDLGMITRDDVMVALSYSGESEELATILPLVKRLGVPLVALTGNGQSTLARLADVVLDTKVEKEACPLNLAPTASTTVALALGDALAIALLDARGFGHEDFARAHPAGALGRRLLTHVRDVMRVGDDAPAVLEGARLVDAVLEISRKRMGMTAIVDSSRHLVGIFTDGDLRRSLERGVDLHATSVDAVMTRSPRTIRPEALAAAAVELMEEHKLTQLPVVDADDVMVGALNIHDLFRGRVL